MVTFMFSPSIEDQFIAYEYRKGASPVNKREMHPAFFDELIKYLARNDLAGLLGQSLIVPESRESGC